MQGYHEGELTFPPTFKFDPGTDVYDSTAKSRIPSWCDRVLWRCNTDASESVELLQYKDVPQLKVSDHRYECNSHGRVCTMSEYKPVVYRCDMSCVLWGTHADVARLTLSFSLPETMHAVYHSASQQELYFRKLQILPESQARSKPSHSCNANNVQLL